MPRGQYYPEELREEARRLRREGWSLNEIAAKLGPPKNTLTLWVGDIELTSEQSVSRRLSSPLPRRPGAGIVMARPRYEVVGES